MPYTINGVSYSGDPFENVDGFLANTLSEARETAHQILTEGRQFTAWVQGNGVNECHMGQSADCPICHPATGGKS